ncbi:MAG: T9SS type A sorting domain-containing protein [Dysgonamonadaceae bacterium]|jgi:hypothetical protein|nr:T9SS type A sorting domain-containing protein [Dysgonamonadaceae bacterium]
MKKGLIALYLVIFIFTGNASVWAARLSGNTNERVFINTSIGSSTTKYTVSGTDGFLYIRDLLEGDEVTATVVNEDPNDPATIFTAPQIIPNASGGYSYIQPSGGSKGICFTPLEAKTYRATLTIYINGAALTPSIPLSGTGIVYPIFNFKSTTSIDSSLVQRVPVSNLTDPVTLARAGIIDDAEGVFSVVDAGRYETGDSVDVRFTPKDALLYTAYLAIDNNRNAILTATGRNSAFYSVDGKEIWQYIQFVSTGKVITQNGNGNPLTANDRMENDDTQLWKAIPSSIFSMDLLINKDNPNLSIRFRENRYIAVAGQVEANPVDVPNDAVYLYTTLGQYATNYLSLTRVADIHEPLEASAARPENNSDGAPISINETENGRNTPETYLRFIYHSPTGTAINPLNVVTNKSKVYPNPANKILFIESEEPATSISVINSIGQTVLKTSPKSKFEQLPVAGFVSGVYFLEIERSSGIERAKFIKR